MARISHCFECESLPLSFEVLVGNSYHLIIPGTFPPPACTHTRAHALTNTHTHTHFLHCCVFIGMWQTANAFFI